MKPKPSDLYRAYLLRLWRSDMNEPWRATLVNVDSKQELQFPDLQHLSTYLNQQSQLDSEGGETRSP